MNEQAEEWKRLNKESVLETFLVWFMWRPKGGKFERGKTGFPREGN